MTTTQEIVHCKHCGIQQVARGGVRPEACPFCNSTHIWFESEDIPERGDDLRKRLPSRYTQ